MPGNAVDMIAYKRAVRRIDYLPSAGENYRQFTLLDTGHRQRYLAEEFIRQVFFKAYGARINSFYPLLLSIQQKPDHQSFEFAAVAGIRPADAGPLFLEQYLESPIEEVLDVPREKIIEIGNLAPANAGQARWLIATLNAFMLGAGFSYVVFTAVPSLKNAFGRMGLPLTRLADAHSHSLPVAEKANWGSYYDAGPKVFAGDLHLGEMPLTSIARQNPFLDDWCRHAARAGQGFRNGQNHQHLTA